MGIHVQNNNAILENYHSVYSITEHRKLHNNISDKSACYEKSYKTPDPIETVVTSGRVSIAFFPLELILRILGRFPLEIHQPFLGTNKIPKIFVSFLRWFNWIYFLLTTLGLVFLLVITTLGFAIYYLSWNIVRKSSNHGKELQLYSANLVPYVLFWGCLLHATVGSIAIILNRKYIVKYFKMWNDLVDLLHVPLPFCVGRFLILSNIPIFSFFLFVIMFYHYNVVPIVRGTARLIVLLIRKPFSSDDSNIILDESPTTPLMTMGFLIILYVIYASRALVLLFTFKCRLLRLCFINWNSRLRSELTYDPKCTRSHDGVLANDREKANCDKLFRDHCRLIKMLRKTDVVFAASLQSYYLTQVLNMCFELYYLARTDCFSKTHEDIFAGFLLATQTFLIFFMVSLEGAYVNDAAMEGFQILRSRGMQLMDSLEKKYLIQNLLVNYSHNLAITGGRFFSLDRPFIIKVLGAVFTYFVIILQFGSEIGGDCSNYGR